MIETIIVVTSILLVVPSIIQFASSWTAKGRRFFDHICRHVRAQVESRRIWLPILATTALLLVPFSLAADKPVVITFVLCIWTSTMIRWTTPPTLLLLGVSGTKCNALLSLLLPAVFPNKVFHLLRDEYENRERDVSVKLHTLFTTSRTSGSVRWESVVTTYVHLYQRILVDLRDHSANLQVELSIIASSAQENRNKVLYLVAEGTTTALVPIDRGCEGRICKTVNDAIRRLRTGI